MIARRATIDQAIDEIVGVHWRLLPLRAGSGEVRAYALVDADMVAEVVGYHWRLSDGYAKRWTRAAGKRRGIYLHRQLLGVDGDRSVEVDHLNGDRLDNRLANLRTVPIGANAQNRNFCTAGASRFRGVSWQKRSGGGVWQAKARLAGEQRHLGYFQSELAAAQAAEAFRLEHMPFAQPDPELARYGRGTPVPLERVHSTRSVS